MAWPEGTDPARVPKQLGQVPLAQPPGFLHSRLCLCRALYKASSTAVVQARVNIAVLVFGHSKVTTCLRMSQTWLQCLTTSAQRAGRSCWSPRGQDYSGRASALDPHGNTGVGGYDHLSKKYFQQVRNRLFKEVGRLRRAKKKRKEKADADREGGSHFDPHEHNSLPGLQVLEHGATWASTKYRTAGPPAKQQQPSNSPSVQSPFSWRHNKGRIPSSCIFFPSVGSVQNLHRLLRAAEPRLLTKLEHTTI